MIIIGRREARCNIASTRNMPITIKWDITYKCNLNCEHCINGDKLGHLNEELTFEEIEDIVFKLPKENINFISILGGEPTARKDFVKIMQLLDRVGIYFSFNTNGLILNKRELQDEIVNNTHLKNIVFSLEGPNEEINDQIRGKKVFKNTRDNIKNIIHLKEFFNLNNLSITINTVLSKLNKDYISEMIDMCDELEVTQFNLLQMIEQGNAKDKHFSVTAEEEIKVAEVIINKLPYLKSKLSISPRFTYPMINLYLEKKFNKSLDITHGCGAGTIFAYMNNKGELYPCDRYTKEILEHYPQQEINIKEHDFYEVFGKEKFEDIYSIYKDSHFGKNTNPCNKCKYLNSECIPCPVVFPDKDIVEKCQYFYHKARGYKNEDK